MADDKQQADDTARLKARNLDRLEGDDAMMTYTLLLAAAMAGGNSASAAAKQADAAISDLKRRFT